MAKNQTTEKPLADHRADLYVDRRDRFTYECRDCAEVSGPFLYMEYARDGMREAHGLAPLINYRVA